MRQIPEQDYERAKKKVKERKGFYGHLTAYLATGIFFLAINMLNFDGDIWFYWPLLGWGIGLLIHYFNVFGLPFVGRLDEDWEEKEIQKELDENMEIEEYDELELRALEKHRRRNYNNDDLV